MKKRLNTIMLNVRTLNLVGDMRTGSGGSGGGGGDVPVEPSIPDGYEAFFAFDGVFSAADGEFYVKL